MYLMPQSTGPETKVLTPEMDKGGVAAELFSRRLDAARLALAREVEHSRNVRARHSQFLDRHMHAMILHQCTEHD